MWVEWTHENVDAVRGRVEHVMGYILYIPGNLKGAELCTTC